jgi:drug/metabolite transporter (DMT)-like permease
LPVTVWLGLVTVYVLWGTTYLGIRASVETIPPFLMTGMRWTLAGVLLFSFATSRQIARVGWPSLRDWAAAAVTGSIMFVVGNGLLAWAEQTVPSGLAAMILAAPLWLAVFGWLLLREPVPWLSVAGLATGFIGIVILVGPVGPAA